MKIKTKLEESIRGRLSEVMDSGYSDEDFTKTLTVRLPIQEYARLKMLASRLKDTTSNTGKTLVIAALDDAIQLYLEFCPDDVEDFALACHEAFEELLP